jgi:hypothetical protein
VAPEPTPGPGLAGGLSDVRQLFPTHVVPVDPLAVSNYLHE